MGKQITVRHKVKPGQMEQLKYRFLRAGTSYERPEQNCMYRLDYTGDLGRVIVRQYRTGTLTITGQQGDRLINELSSMIGRSVASEPEGSKLIDQTGGRPRIGSDESGKGDYFGPLTVAAVYVDEASERLLVEAGVKDCKDMGNDEVTRVARDIEHIVGQQSETVMIMPKRYNELYNQIRDQKGKPNLNHLLAWAHGRAIENLLMRTNSDLVVTDKFAAEKLLASKLRRTGCEFELIQVPRAESDVAVAAASILARAKFLASMDKLSAKVGRKLPKGAGAAVVSTARDLVSKQGDDVLGDIAKLHFKTTVDVIQTRL